MISILVLITLVYLVFYSIYIVMATEWKYYKMVEMMSKTFMDVVIFIFAAYGTYLNPRMRNMILLETMFIYACANEISSYFIALSGPFYIAGHILLIYNLSQTGRIRKIQHFMVIALTTATAVLLFSMMDTINMVLQRKKNLIPFEISGRTKYAVLILLGIYTMILWMKLVYSLGNRFYWMSAIFFTTSDIIGGLSILKILRGQKYTVVLLYFVAIMFYAISTYNCTEKEVVTFRDVFILNHRFKKSKLRYFIYGKWALNLSANLFTAQTGRYEIAYDVDEFDEMKTLLTKKLKFEVRQNQFPVEAELYSERYGYLTIHGVYFNTESGIMWLSKESGLIEMDEDYFRTVHYLDYEIPCLFPVGEGDEALEFLKDDEEDDNPFNFMSMKQ
ncbi:MAG: hypothetical protein IJT32_02055 [Lachnospiraceae bacterium]|nr:hypothetical protein [Lachnospiraceae bacterium]